MKSQTSPAAAPSDAVDGEVVWSRRRTLLALTMIVASFLMLRGTIMWFRPGLTDEEWFAVPGLTVIESGVPRVPYAPIRSPDSFFYKADEMLYAMPPLLFYVEAPFFAVLPDTYGTARIPALLAGAVAIVLVFLLGRGFFADDRAAVLAAGLYSLARMTFFPATIARPDMLCGMLGLLAIWTTWQWTQSRRTKWLIITGATLGLAALTHPFSIVFAMQIGPWLFIEGRGWKQRIAAPAAVALVTLAVLSLWVPLIWLAPDLFVAQFGNNILAPAGPGLVSRMLMPAASFAHYVPQLVELAHPVQFTMLVVGWVLHGIFCWRWRRRGHITCWLLAGTSVYLLISSLGIHAVLGYWCYPVAFFCLCTAAVLIAIGERAAAIVHRPQLVWMTIVIGAGLVMVPGSGIRTVIAYVRHWSDPDYNAPAFVRRVLDDLPPDARLTVGTEFVLDAYACGRDVTLGIRHPMYFDSTEIPAEYVILSRLALAEGLANDFDADLVRTYGDRGDEFSCYAEVYRVRTGTQ